MGMRRVDQEIPTRNFQLALKPFPQFRQKLFANIRQHSLTDLPAPYRRNIHGNDDNFCFAVIQHQCLGVQRIIDHNAGITISYLAFGDTGA